MSSAVVASALPSRCSGRLAPAMTAVAVAETVEPMRKRMRTAEGAAAAAVAIVTTSGPRRRPKPKAAERQEQQRKAEKRNWVSSAPEEEEEEEAGESQEGESFERVPSYDRESLFSVRQRPLVLHLTRVERTVASELCSKRRLGNLYYEGTLSLWMRVKSCYPLGDPVYVRRQLLIAMFLTIKFCGPAWTTFEHVTVDAGRADAPELTKDMLLEEELAMCTLLQWKFF